LHYLKLGPKTRAANNRGTATNLPGGGIMHIIRIVLALSCLLAASNAAMAQAPANADTRVLSVTPQATIRAAPKWQAPAEKYSNARELIVTGKAMASPQPGAPPQMVDATLARVMVSEEQRTSHEDALQRLQDIALSRSEPARFTEIGGWPAVEIDYMEPLPRKSIATRTPAVSVPRTIIAIAADTRVLKYDIALSEGTPEALREEAKQIARSSTFPKRHDPVEVKKSIERMDQAVKIKARQPDQPTSEAPVPPSLAQTSQTLALRRHVDAAAPGTALVQTSVGELEIATSRNARDIIIASNGGLSFSRNLGATFAPGNVGTFGLNDPTLARAASGNFYLGVIAFPNGSVAHQSVTGCTNAVSRSTDNGANFVLRGYSARCPQTGTGICFPDQEHIAADDVNQAGGNDQIYAVWRNFTPSGAAASCGAIGSGFVTSSITCSQNNATTWTATAAIPGGGDFPRVAVARDGSVYVTTISGNSVLLNRFASCAAGLTAAPGFPVTVGTLGGPVACPVAGLDRCNDGNTLASPTPAPDPGNANRVFVTFGERSGSGERIITAESNDRGATFPRRTTVSAGNTARRFMPWSCSTRGRSFSGWYDRSAATTSATDLTDYFMGSAWGSTRNLTASPDPQCASGWPSAPRSTNDSETCSVQPQRAGVCMNAAGGGSGARCDFSDGGCAAGETCTTGGGSPKYGDYNGIACAGNWVVTAWASATSPRGLPAGAGLRVFSSSQFVGDAGAAIWRHTGTPCSGESCPGWQRLDNNPKTVAIASAANELYQLHSDGWIWRHNGVACDVDLCPGWQRLDNNPKTIAIAAGGNQLYQLHHDGWIWRHTGNPCNGDSCPGWVRLDNNSKTVAIVANATSLYQLHKDGRIWRHTGTACSGDSCPGWQMLDNNNKTIAIAVNDTQLYQLHRDGWIWRHTGNACAGESCPGWQRLDNNPKAVAITASGSDLYQLHKDGWIWRHTGTPCNGDSCPGWARLDNNPKTVGIAAAGSALFQLHNDGWIWRFTGTPCNGESCPGWQRLDNNPRTGMVAAGNQLFQLHTDPLYQLHNDGWIWRYTGTECDGETCPGWQRLDNNANTVQLAAAGKILYQRHRDGKIWRHTGTPCNGDACPGWQMLDNNGNTQSIAAGGAQLFQLHRDGKIWRHMGTPCNGNSCPSWEMLDNNPRTRAIAAGGNQVYQLHTDGRIWRHTGTACAGNACPGWQMLDNNGNTVAIAAAESQLFQLHRDGRIWRHTGTGCTGESCPGWQMLDNNGNTQSIAAGGNQLFQLHRDGKIWRHTGVGCTGAACPGWQMLDNNTNTRELVVAAGHLYQRHVNGMIWRYVGPPCAGTSCPGWVRLDNNPKTIAIVTGSRQ
jgi:hypothetical protein